MLYNYPHASALFTGGSTTDQPGLTPRRLDPKASWLFQVRFELNHDVARIGNTDQSLELLEAGMLATSVQLPKFTIENKVLNAYNRVNIVQSKIKYDPVTITFHDDHSNVVLNLWKDYFAHYYRDGDYGTGGGTSELSAAYTYQHKYVERTERDWGFTPRTNSKGATGKNIQYIKSIRIYSLSQGSITEYILVNPTITSFQHGEHSASEGTTLMKHTMSVGYETVLYYQGDATSDTIAGFDDPTAHYFQFPSYLKNQDSTRPTSNNVNSDISDPTGRFSTLTDNYYGVENTKNSSLTALQNSEVNGQIESDQTQEWDPTQPFKIPYIRPYQSTDGLTNTNSNQAGMQDNPPTYTRSVAFTQNNNPPSNAVSSNGSDVGTRSITDYYGSPTADLPKDNPDGTTTSRTYIPPSIFSPRSINNPPE